MHRRNVKISGAPERFFTQKLRDERRLRFNVETIQGSAEDNLAPSVDGRREPAFRQEAQKMFVPKSAELPTWVEFRQKIEDLLVEERISDLHRGVHRNTIPFGLEQVSSQSDTCCDPDTPIQRMPAFGAFQGDSQISPGIKFLHHFAHRRSVEPQL